MRDFAEVVRQVAVNNLVVPPVQEAADALYRAMGAPFRPVGVLLRGFVKLTGFTPKSR